LVLARHLATLDRGAPVFVIGEPPLIDELRAHGFEVRPDHHVRWVVIAFDRTFDYAKLNVALQAVRRSDARLIATNPDRTCPTEDGEIPDCAGMIAAVEAVTERRVVVIGGGMAGAGVARDLALRGVAVALVEKADFAWGTTSRSSKLIHGGLRYLELFDFGLVRESLRERERLQRLAPHVVRPLPFLVPIYRDSSRRLIEVCIGMKLYDWLTPGR